VTFVANIVEKFKATLKADGLRVSMQWLNDRVPYRYTAIFAFDGDILRNLCLIDKENSEIDRCADQPITDSYCIYIHRSGEAFSLEESLGDSRADGHPKQRSYRCYYGIPLLGPNGKLLGTVCHFDTAPIGVTEDIVTALDDLAPWIAEAAFSGKTKD
jgi:GAF domain-containing protein